MRIAYYNWRNDNKWRRLMDMRDDVSEFGLSWRFHKDFDGAWIDVGDKKLIEIDNCISKWEVSEHYNPIFNSYNAALKWLKGEEEMPTFKINTYDKVLEHISIADDCTLNFDFLIDSITKYLALPLIKRIEQNVKNGTIYTTVLWEDNSDATVVKCAEDDTDDLYFAVASAIAIKLYGSNSAFKRMIDEKADILEEPAKTEFSINMNNFAENIRKAFKYKGDHND